MNSFNHTWRQAQVPSYLPLLTARARPRGIQASGTMPTYVEIDISNIPSRLAAGAGANIWRSSLSLKFGRPSCACVARADEAQCDNANMAYRHDIPVLF